MLLQDRRSRPSRQSQSGALSCRSGAQDLKRVPVYAYSLTSSARATSSVEYRPARAAVPASRCARRRTGSARRQRPSPKGLSDGKKPRTPHEDPRQHSIAKATFCRKLFAAHLWGFLQPLEPAASQYSAVAALAVGSVFNLSCCQRGRFAAGAGMRRVVTVMCKVVDEGDPCLPSAVDSPIVSI
jgi:hypothetical protein